MKTHFAFLALALIFLNPAAQAAPPTDGSAPAAMETVPSLDVPRYMGRWYEIAKYPNRFQKKCVADTSAEYSLLPDGNVRVINRCRLENGAFDEAIGAARQIGGATSPKLEVRFAPAWLSFIPAVWGNYWVVELDPDYQWVVVSEPKREYLWILARTPSLAPEVLSQITHRLQNQGLDPKRLEKSVHQNIQAK